MLVKDDTSVNCAFSFKLALNGVHYEYEVTIINGKLIDAMLKELKDGNTRLLFTRDTNGYSIVNMESVDISYSKNDVTLLKQLTVLGNDVCSNIFNWVKDSLIVVDLDDTLWYDTDGIDLDKVSDIVSKLNLGIARIELDNGVLVNLLDNGARAN